MRDVFVPFAVTRGALMLVGVLALTLMPTNPNNSGKWEESSHAWVNAWSRWDAGWYLGIAREGYTYHPDAESRVAFYPMLPLLMRLLHMVGGREDGESWLVAGIVVSNLALLVALGYLIALVRLDFDEATAARTALYLLVFPTSLFLSAVYAESLFLAFAVASFYHARCNRWWVAGLLGGAAALTRPLLVMPLAFEYAAQRHFDLHRLRLDVLAIGLIPAGLATYMLYLGWHVGDPLASVRVQAAWGRELMPPWETFRGFFSAPLVVHGPDHSVLDLSFVLLFAGLVGSAWILVRPSYAVFATVLLLTVVSSGRLGSLMRFGLVMFPAFLVLAMAGRHPQFDRAYVIAATGLASLFMMMFALWYWLA
jgi:hypothetical protein